MPGQRRRERPGDDDFAGRARIERERIAYARKRGQAGQTMIAVRLPSLDAQREVDLRGRKFTDWVAIGKSARRIRTSSQTRVENRWPLG